MVVAVDYIVHEAEEEPQPERPVRRKPRGEEVIATVGDVEGEERVHLPIEPALLLGLAWVQVGARSHEDPAHADLDEHAVLADIGHAHGHTEIDGLQGANAVKVGLQVPISEGIERLAVLLVQESISRLASVGVG